MTTMRRKTATTMTPCIPPKILKTALRSQPTDKVVKEEDLKEEAEVVEEGRIAELELAATELIRMAVSFLKAITTKNQRVRKDQMLRSFQKL